MILEINEVGVGGRILQLVIPAVPPKGAMGVSGLGGPAIHPAMRARRLQPLGSWSKSLGCMHLFSCPDEDAEGGEEGACLVTLGVRVRAAASWLLY